MALTAELLKGPPRTRCREHSFSSSLCYARVCGGSELRSRFDAHSVTQFWFALEMTQALRTKSPEPERQILSRHITNSAIRSCIRFVLHPFFSSFFFLFSSRFSVDCKMRIERPRSFYDMLTLLEIQKRMIDIRCRLQRIDGYIHIRFNIRHSPWRIHASCADKSRVFKYSCKT